MKIKWLRYNRKKVYIALFLFLVLFGLTFGYAFVTTKLSIEGVARVKDAKWDVHFTNFQPVTGSVTPVEDPTISNTSITFSAKLENPGDFYGFTIDVVNQGTINADISNISVTPDFSSIDYIDATVAYNNDNSIQIGDILAAGKTKTIKVYLKYKEGIDENLYPTTDQTHSVTVALGYKQYVGYVPSFQNDSWTTISANVTQDKEIYDVGETKTIELDINNSGTKKTYTLRVANNTTPSECSQEGFSQSACGFVLEFADIISLREMNSTATNVGGWPASEMYTYLNDTSDTNSIYNKIKAEIGDIIINTETVSGHGNTTGETNFTSTDKLYLLSIHEVCEDDDNDPNNGIDYWDAAYNNTRQLDYYRNKGVTSSNYSGAIKETTGSYGHAYNWWNRSTSTGYNHGFYNLNSSGAYGVLSAASSSGGVSPAFRIG